MDIVSYARRINSVSNIQKFGETKDEYSKQYRLAVKNNEMSLEEVNKCKFPKINDKRYYFEDGIVSLPFSHPYLLDIVKYKRDKKNKKWRDIEAILKSHRLSALQSIYLQWAEFRNLSSNKRCVDEAGKRNFSLNLRSFLLNGFLR